MEIERQVSAHYARDSLLDAILEALRAAGLDPARLRPQDLAPIEELHVRGRAATEELGRALAPMPGAAVLDVGCGLGGPSRHMAAAHGCRVTGLDLTEAYCRTARALARRLGASGPTTYLCASALALPFPAACFDAAYTQHVAMNVADKPRLYAGIAHVLKPGGRFGIYDLLRGPGGEVRYPTPWARDAATSFLVSGPELRALLESAGFEILSWRETPEEARAWIAAARDRQRRQEGPGLTPAVLFGPEFAAMGRNMARNIEEARVVPVEVICRRP